MITEGKKEKPRDSQKVKREIRVEGSRLRAKTVKKTR